MGGVVGKRCAPPQPAQPPQPISAASELTTKSTKNSFVQKTLQSEKSRSKAKEAATESKKAEGKKDEKGEGSKKGEEHDTEHLEECVTQLPPSEDEPRPKVKSKEKSCSKTSDKGSVLKTARAAKSESGTGSLPRKDSKRASARLKKLKGEASKRQDVKKDEAKKDQKDSLRASVRKQIKSVKGTISRIRASSKDSKKEGSRKSKVQEKAAAKPEKKSRRSVHASPKKTQRKKTSIRLLSRQMLSAVQLVQNNTSKGIEERHDIKFHMGVVKRYYSDILYKILKLILNKSAVVQIDESSVCVLDFLPNQTIMPASSRLNCRCPSYLRV
ncbi:hypothetical protein Y032_0069g386 [Ancylostoma ceylanicum]|uniref:Uncharacterized protein n=1 Tax=Ancylostoma ceylanicum TaxID=53326 RepID=A0A016TYA1_9BILA|nr:hypothetical protein Y032_0069g386 [Ancylostoma ceylanicum]